MRVLIACERSAVIRQAFEAVGCDAWSCDLQPSAVPGKHFQQDLFTPSGEWALPDDFDLGIFHPPCTRLAVSGAHLFKGREVEQRRAVWFFMACINAPLPRIAVENPVSVMSTLYRKPDQIIQPYEFGDDASKKTCLWLKNLPPLVKTGPFVPPRMVDGKPRWANQTNSGQNRLGPSADRADKRAQTYPGIARAMAEQWGKL